MTVEVAAGHGHLACWGRTSGSPRIEVVMADRTWLVDLSADDCVARLEAGTIGRLGVLVGRDPTVFPVGYVFLDGCIYFLTTDGTKMQGALSWPTVGFEIDGEATDRRSAWSVMVRGSAEEVEDPAAIQKAVARLPALYRDPDATGVHWVRITPSTITGRLITRTGGDEGLTFTFPR